MSVRDLRPIDWFDLFLDAGPALGAVAILALTLWGPEKQTGHLIGDRLTRAVRRGTPSVAEQPYAQAAPGASANSP